MREIAAELKREPGPASRFIRKLERIVYWIDARESHIAQLLRVPLLYDLQVALAAEAWRRRWGARIRACVDAVGEMEALLSFAAYSFEHPNDPFPDFVEANQSQPLFDGAELGHPLIPAAQCVRNSVRLDPTARVPLVSGSNMSGKSTFLRTVGMNAVLSMAGAPIRGKSLRLTPIVLGTRFRTTDSLQENRSSFYTEILRIRQVFELTNGNASLLFLFDELLSMPDERLVWDVALPAGLVVKKGERWVSEADYYYCAQVAVRLRYRGLPILIQPLQRHGVYR